MDDEKIDIEKIADYPNDNLVVDLLIDNLEQLESDKISS